LNEKLDATEPKYVQLDFGEVLGSSLRYWLKNVKSFWMIFFVIHLVMVAIGYGAFFLSGGSLLVAEAADILGAIIPYWVISSYFLDIVSIAIVIVLGAVIIVNIGIGTVLGGMVIRHTAEHHAEQIPTLGESFRDSRNRFLVPHRSPNFDSSPHPLPIRWGHISHCSYRSGLNIRLRIFRGSRWACYQFSRTVDSAHLRSNTFSCCIPSDNSRW